jgi:hypothetical protein
MVPVMAVDNLPKRPVWIGEDHPGLRVSHSGGPNREHFRR